MRLYSRIAQIAIGVLLVVIIRSLAEYLRLYTPPAPPAAGTPDLTLYIWGAIGGAPRCQARGVQALWMAQRHPEGSESRPLPEAAGHHEVMTWAVEIA